MTKTRRTSERGVSTLEMAFALPVFTLLTVGLIDIFQIVRETAAVTQAVNEAAVEGAAFDAPTCYCRAGNRALNKLRARGFGSNIMIRASVDRSMIQDSSSAMGAMRLEIAAAPVCVSCSLFMGKNGLKIRKEALVPVEFPRSCEGHADRDSAPSYRFGDPDHPGNCDCSLRPEEC